MVASQCQVLLFKNTKLFFLPSSSFVLPIVAFNAGMDHPPTPFYVLALRGKKKSLTFINTSNLAPLSQRHDSTGKRTQGPSHPGPVVCEEPFALRSPIRLHTTNNPPVLWNYSLSWNVSLPRPCRVKKWRSFWLFSNQFHVCIPLNYYSTHDPLLGQSNQWYGFKKKRKKNQGTSSAVFTANYSKFRSFKGFLPLYSFVDSGGVHEWDIMVRGLVQAESHASSMAFELQTSSPHFVTLSPMMCFFRLKLSHTHTHTYTHKESSDDSFSTDSYEQVQKNI